MESIFEAFIWINLMNPSQSRRSGSSTICFSHNQPAPIDLSVDHRCFVCGPSIIIIIIIIIIITIIVTI